MATKQEIIQKAERYCQYYSAQLNYCAEWEKQYYAGLIKKENDHLAELLKKFN